MSPVAGKGISVRRVLEVELTMRRSNHTHSLAWDFFPFQSRALHLQIRIDSTKCQQSLCLTMLFVEEKFDWTSWCLTMLFEVLDSQSREIARIQVHRELLYSGLNYEKHARVPIFPRCASGSCRRSTIHTIHIFMFQMVVCRTYLQKSPFLWF